MPTLPTPSPIATRAAVDLTASPRTAAEWRTAALEGSADRRLLLDELASARADAIALTVATNALRAIELLAPQDGDDAARFREKLVSVFALTKIALTTLGSVEGA